MGSPRCSRVALALGLLVACGPHGDGSPDTPRVPADWWCFGAPPCEATGPCEVATCDWETGTCVSAAATAPATGALSPECLEVEVAVNPCDGSRPREAPATACFIAGVCVPDQTPFPLDPCQVCDAATAPFDWVAADCQGCEPGVGCPAPDGGTDEAACQPGELVSPCVECDPIGAPTLDRACDDGDACTEDECRPDVGCVFIPTPGGCDDQDDCTVDQCDPVAGCVHLPRPCDDGEPCTHDGCDPTTGCHHRAAPCPDGGACLVARCAEGGGCALVGLTCDDGDPCTVDSCGAVTGCTSTPLTCDDGDACTVDLCDAAGCHHTRRLCDDGDACTADSCDAGTGCAHPPWPCDDGDACTDDECSAGSCLHAPSDCDDGDACTVDQCDPAAGCVTGAVDCHDGNSCTLDGCDPVLGCSWSPAPGGCEDGDACTTPDVCVDGVCQGGPRDGAQLDVDFETLTGTGFADAAPPAEDAEVLGSPPGQVVVTTAAGATALVAPDPSTSTVRADLPTSTSTAAWTFLAWLEPQASGSGQALGQLASRRLIPKNPASAETRWLTFYTGDFPGGATADPDDLVGVTLPGPGASRQLAAVTYDGATLRGYFDFDALVAGAEVADVELPKNLAPWTFGPALWLGARPQGATPPTDRPIDRVVWFDRALAPAELVHVATADPWAAPLCGGCDPEDSCPTFVTSACWQTACQPAHGGCVSLPDGLVASYDLEAVVDAEVPDGTGHGHTAVNVGGTAVLGVGEGLALAFAGGGTGCASGLVIPTAGGLGAPSFTLSLWWRHQGAGGGATSEVVAEVPLRDADQSPWTARLSVEALTWGPAVYSSPGGLGLADGQWHHVALSHGPAGVQVLVDGAAVTLCAVADVAQGCEAVVPPWRPDLQAAAEPTAACGADGVDAAAAVDDVRWHLRGLDEPTIGRLLAGVVDLCDDGDPCTLDGCSPFLGCLHGDVPCDDASACTVDSCDAEGACVHEPTVSCDDDGEPCTDERCDPASGGCVTTPNTAPCDDGDPCTVGDRCGAGACGALLHAPCDDDLPCTVDGCDPSAGCSNTPRVCDDGDPCTADACDPATGTCSFEPPCDLGDPCTLTGCVVETGACWAVPVDCDDGDACTEDFCGDVGECVHEAATACDDGDVCTDDVCDPETGGCVFVPGPAAAACLPHCASLLTASDPRGDGGSALQLACDGLATPMVLASTSSWSLAGTSWVTAGPAVVHVSGGPLEFDLTVPEGASLAVGPEPIDGAPRVVVRGLVVEWVAGSGTPGLTRVAAPEGMMVAGQARGRWDLTALPATATQIEATVGGLAGSGPVAAGASLASLGPDAAVEVSAGLLGLAGIDSAYSRLQLGAIPMDDDLPPDWQLVLEGALPWWRPVAAGPATLTATGSGALPDGGAADGRVTSEAQDIAAEAGALLGSGALLSGPWSAAGTLELMVPWVSAERVELADATARGDGWLHFRGRLDPAGLPDTLPLKGAQPRAAAGLVGPEGPWSLAVAGDLIAGAIPLRRATVGLHADSVWMSATAQVQSTDVRVAGRWDAGDPLALRSGDGIAMRWGDLDVTGALEISPDGARFVGVCDVPGVGPVGGVLRLDAAGEPVAFEGTVAIGLGYPDVGAVWGTLTVTIAQDRTRAVSFTGHARAADGATAEIDGVPLSAEGTLCAHWPWDPPPPAPAGCVLMR